MARSQRSRLRSQTFYDSDNESDRDDVSSAGSETSHSNTTSSEDEDPSLLNKLPTLPDLRFEQSYLATIRGFMHEYEADQKPTSEIDHNPDDEKTEADQDQPDHHHKVSITKSKAKDSHELWLGNLRVEWFPILYVTLRDQMISPLVQGAVWGLGGIILTQVRQFIAAKGRTPSTKHPFRSGRRR